MGNFNLEKAFMAVKAQRYEEAQNSYERALETEYSVEAWTGLGICKLFQLTENQTMEEVTYCFSKAKEVDNADINKIDLQLISYSNLVLERATAFCINLMERIKQAESEKNAALITSGIAMAIASNSNSSFGQIASGVIAGASAGVAVGKFAEISDIKTAGQLAFQIIDDISIGVNNFLVDNNKLPEAQAFNNRVIELKNIIDEKSKVYQKANKWYNKTGWLVFWWIIFWPVGLVGTILHFSNKKK